MQQTHVHYDGLSLSEAAKRLSDYGKNILPDRGGRGKLRIFLSQFSSPLMYLLVFAGIITFFLQHLTDTLVIFAAVFVNTILGYYQELKAEKALLALKKMLNPTAKVVRSAQVLTIPVEFIVPGDYLIISRGDRIPADGDIINSVDFNVSESIITGESESILKRKGDQVYMGTTVTNGRGIICITKTGSLTMMGGIAEQLAEVRETLTPLQLRLKNLAKIIAIVVLGLALITFFIGVVSGRTFSEMLLTSVAIAVASIPEGMAISLTVILVLGMQRILKQKALVKSLVAAETLGSVTVIATDKTGTLTEGDMRVVRADVKDKNEALFIAAYANNIENPVESALWRWVESSHLDPESMCKNIKRTAETPFNSERKYMSVEVNGKTYIKGAPEKIIEMCSLTLNEKKKIIKEVIAHSAHGYRLIALASGSKKKLEWCGLLFLEDPIRAGLGDVFLKTRKAGIRIMMITGDYSGTALSVWKKINGDKNYEIFEGKEINLLTDQELRHKVKSVDIFARVDPQQKLRIIEALKHNGEVVALVGDGVNDAPALKKADIGIVVGEASDVSKETADLILLDSNFNTIISAIEEGRVIYDNIKKVILFLLSDSFIQVILVIGSILLNLPLPLTAAQILWINFITDGIPAIALTAEKKEKNILKRTPIRSDLPIIDMSMGLMILLISVGTGCLALFFYKELLTTIGYEQAQTFIFESIGFATLLLTFSVRSLTEPLWKKNITSNIFLLGAVSIGMVVHLAVVILPVLRNILTLTRLDHQLWQLVLIFSVIIIASVELTKYFIMLYQHKKTSC